MVGHAQKISQPRLLVPGSAAGAAAPLYPIVGHWIDSVLCCHLYNCIKYELIKKKLQLRSYIIYIDTLLTWKEKSSAESVDPEELVRNSSRLATRPSKVMWFHSQIAAPKRQCFSHGISLPIKVDASSSRSTSKAWLKTPELRAAPDNNLSRGHVSHVHYAENQELQYANWLAEVSPKISKIQWPKIKSTRGTHFCRFSEGSTWGHRLPMRSWVFLS